MPKHYDLLVRGGTLVDAAAGVHAPCDVALEGGRVARVEPGLPAEHAREVHDAAGCLVMPGLVDTHVHVTPPHRSVGYRMMARAGVTCCLDCAGPVEDAVRGLALNGAGIAVAVLNKLDPGVTISGPDAPADEVQDYLDRSLAAGALGLKLLGGHLPLSPATTAAAIAAANRAGAYAAFHCGTTRQGSNLHGLLEALELAGDHRLHVCHINAYCRGLTHGSPVRETLLALEALAGRPHLVSESHPAPFNSVWSRLEDDRPRSHVARTCLEAGGFTPDRAGLLEAARAGYLRVQQSTDRGAVFLDPAEAPDRLAAVNFETMVSFPVNRRSTAFLCATEKDADGRFVVTALSTDGGGIPRNFLLSHGLALVRFEALTLLEFVHKCCRAPALMLGLPQKGHLQPGADADLVVVDPLAQSARLTVAGGRVVMAGGVVVGRGGTVVTTPRGVDHLRARDVPAVAADLEHSLLYRAPDPPRPAKG